MSTSVKALLSRDEISDLTTKSDWRGAWALFCNWFIIGLTFAGLATYPHPLTFVLAVFILGRQQLAFAVLVHEAAHRTLFRTRWLNDGFTDWLTGRLIWTDVARYREHHIRHHAHTGTKKDPDMSLVEPFPTTRQSLYRKLLRDIVGISGLRRLVGLVLMDIGVLTYSVSADVQRRPRDGRSNWDYAREGLRNLTPVVLSNVLLLGILAAFGMAWVYGAWVVAYLTSFSLNIRIRSIAEHACMPGGADIFDNTRTTRAGLLARLSVAPMNVNYHQEHHLMASVPYYRLPQMHRLLQAKGKGQDAPGYAEVLRIASTPGPAA